MKIELTNVGVQNPWLITSAHRPFSTLKLLTPTLPPARCIQTLDKLLQTQPFELSQAHYIKSKLPDNALFLFHQKAEDFLYARKKNSSKPEKTFPVIHRQTIETDRNRWDREKNHYFIIIINLQVQTLACSVLTAHRSKTVPGFHMNA